MAGKNRGTSRAPSVIRARGRASLILRHIRSDNSDRALHAARVFALLPSVVPQTPERALEMREQFTWKDARQAVALEAGAASWEDFCAREKGGQKEGVSVFYVQQNIDYLFGRYITTAVVAGPSEEAVRDAILSMFPSEERMESSVADEDGYVEGAAYAYPADPEFYEGPMAYADRLTVTQIGTMDEAPKPVGINKVGTEEIGPGVLLLAMNWGVDWGV